MLKDMHIHVRNSVLDYDKMKLYVERCIDEGLSEVVLLEHGNRMSPKRTAVLYNKEIIKKFKDNILRARQEFPNIKINYGIEIDFSYDYEFRKETLNLLNIGNFDYVIGAIHGMKFNDAGHYYDVIVDMLNIYSVDIIGHIILLRDGWQQYQDKLERIVLLCSQTNTMIEFNTSDRLRWNDEHIEYMLSLFKKYNVNYTTGSDAHSVEQIGYKIKQMHTRVKKR